MAGGYGHVSEQGGDKTKNKKRVAVIAVSSLVLVAMVVAVAVGVNQKKEGGANAGGGNKGEVSASMKSIKTICQPTEFKDTCEQSLSSAAGNTTNPKDLVKAAFQVAIKHISEAANTSAVLHELEKDKMASQALENCKELATYAINDLQNSFEQMGTFDMTKADDLIFDLRVWIDAAVTYQETCRDGFQNTTGDAGEKMKNALKTATELTRNALAIVTEISSVFTEFQLPTSRRLLSTSDEVDGFPSWASASKRKLLAVPANKLKPNVVVAKDGSGKYKAINQALKDIPKNGKTPFIIYVKAGVYAEYVVIDKTMTNVVLIGDGPLKTKITGNKNFIDGTPTFQSATVKALGSGFLARDIGIENTAGPAKHQAVALLVQSDKSIFLNCQFDGYQDTLYTHTGRQLYLQSTISGTIDFIFGNAAALFQNCKMVVRKPMDNQQNIVTAQGRLDRNAPTGIVLQNCIISADPSLVPFVAKIPSYLGRPWKEYSRTIVMQTQIDNLIRPEGWLPWQGDFALKTLFYAEYQNRGPGANLAHRVKWPGIKTPLTKEQALGFTASRFMRLNVDKWQIPADIPYTAAL